MATGRNIKGITVEIGGDTTKLTSALYGVNKIRHAGGFFRHGRGNDTAVYT